MLHGSDRRSARAWRACEHRTRMPVRVGWSEQVEGLTGRRLVRVLCAGFLARIVGPPALQRGRIALSARWFAQVPRRDEIYGAR